MIVKVGRFWQCFVSMQFLLIKWKPIFLSNVTKSHVGRYFLKKEQPIYDEKINFFV